MFLRKIAVESMPIFIGILTYGILEHVTPDAKINSEVFVVDSTDDYENDNFENEKPGLKKVAKRLRKVGRKLNKTRKKFLTKLAYRKNVKLVLLGIFLYYIKKEDSLRITRFLSNPVYYKNKICKLFARKPKGSSARIRNSIDKLCEIIERNSLELDSLIDEETVKIRLIRLKNLSYQDKIVLIKLRFDAFWHSNLDRKSKLAILVGICLTICSVSGVFGLTCLLLLLKDACDKAEYSDEILRAMAELLEEIKRLSELEPVKRLGFLGQALENK